MQSDSLIFHERIGCDNMKIISGRSKIDLVYMDTITTAL